MSLYLENDIWGTVNTSSFLSTFISDCNMELFFCLLTGVSIHHQWVSTLPLRFHSKPQEWKLMPNVQKTTNKHKIVAVSLWMWKKRWGALREVNKNVSTTNLTSYSDYRIQFKGLCYLWRSQEVKTWSCVIWYQIVSSTGSSTDHDAITSVALKCLIWNKEKSS